MLSQNELGVLALLYLLSVIPILFSIHRTYHHKGFSFHLLFSITYLSVFYLGFPFSLILSFNYGILLQSFENVCLTLFLPTVFYLLYHAVYGIRLLPIKSGERTEFLYKDANSKIEAKLTALFLLLIALGTMLVFFMMNGLLLFKLESYNQIFSSQVSGVALKRFFYFFIPALLIFYFISPSKKRWWLFLVLGLLCGIASYVVIGGTRANVALVAALFIFIGIAYGYVSINILFFGAVAGILIMFLLAMQRYNLSLDDSKAVYYFLHLTRDTFSPWESLSRLLAYDKIEYQGLMPIIRDFYVYIPKTVWAERPDLIVNTANYYTWEVLNYYAGLAISPTLIGSFYIMGGFPLIFLGAVICGLIVKGFDSVYFYAKTSLNKNKSIILQAYCFANIFTITVLTREGLDAFVSRFVFFNLIFWSCYLLAKLIVQGLKRFNNISS